MVHLYIVHFELGVFSLNNAATIDERMFCMIYDMTNEAQTQNG